MVAHLQGKQPGQRDDVGLDDVGRGAHPRRPLGKAGGRQRGGGGLGDPASDLDGVVRLEGLHGLARGGIDGAIGLGVAPVQLKMMTWRPTMSPRPRACMCSLMSSSLTLVTLCLIRPASASTSTSTRSRWLPQKEPK